MTDGSRSLGVGTRRPSIRRVAQEAGVSTATVSRVLNETGVVSEAVAARVRKAVAELGYSPNALTRGIFGDATNTIGVLIRDLLSPFYLELMRGIQVVAADADSLVMFANTFAEPNIEPVQIRAMDAQRVRGLIVTTGPDTDHLTARMAARGTSCVIVARRPQKQVLGVHSVRLDNAMAGRVIGRHLVDRQRLRIGVIAGGYEQTIQARITGLRDELDGYGIALDDGSIIPSRRPEDVDGAVSRLLRHDAKGRSLDAVVCLTGRLTVEVYSALAGRGLRIPDDIGLICVDDSPWAEALNLTIVDQPSFEMGQLAARLIVDTGRDSTDHVFEPTLLARGSL